MPLVPYSLMQFRVTANLVNRGRARFQPRRVILLLLCVSVWILIGWQAISWEKQNFGKTIINDFIEYWAAARLLWTGNNPYSPEQIFALQRSVGWTQETPLMMWNPPWTLFFIMPFGLLGYPIGRVVWLIFHSALLLLCAVWIWRLYRGSMRRYWITWVVSFTFLPTLVVLITGQIAPFILLGLMGFLYFQKRQPYWAGAFLVLIAIKPHLIYLFWVALFLWVLDRRRLSVLFGGAIAGLVTMMFPLVLNPAVVKQYLYVAINQPAPATPVYEWAAPTTGGLLRLLFGLEKTWLQFVPLACGVIWFLLYWQKHRPTWDWIEQMPILLLISLSTTPYGWTFDYVVLLPAIIQAAIWTFYCGRPFVYVLAMLAYLATNIVATIMNISRVTDFWYIWMLPALLLIYLTLRGQIYHQSGNLQSDPNQHQFILTE